MLADSHAHLDDGRFENDVETILANARAAGMGFILNPGCNEPTSAKAVALSEAHEMVYAAVGFHPSDCADFVEDIHIPMMTQWISQPKTLAIGEIGLDYFETQMNLANTLGVPIIVHDRDAHQDSLEMVRACLKPETGGVFHSYSGSVEMARQLLDMGLYLSIGGPLTFKNSRKAPDVVAFAPLDRILIETDSPYLTPEPFRGKRNEPAYVSFVAQKVAEIKGVAVEVVEDQTYANCRALFHL